MLHLGASPVHSTRIGASKDQMARNFTDKTLSSLKVQLLQTWGAADSAQGRRQKAAEDAAENSRRILEEEREKDRAWRQAVLQASHLPPPPPTSHPAIPRSSVYWSQSLYLLGCRKSCLEIMVGRGEAPILCTKACPSPPIDWVWCSKRGLTIIHSNAG